MFIFTFFLNSDIGFFKEMCIDYFYGVINQDREDRRKNRCVKSGWVRASP